MNKVLDDMSRFSAAEEFFQYLGVPYEQSVVNVNRLHILKRFNQYLAKANASAGEVESKSHYGKLLQQAYQDFVKSMPSAEKVFKVFQDAEGTQTISIQRVRAAIVERQQA